MYYSDISSDEIRIFHKMQGVDFTISLTDLLSSDLFKVETIRENKLYRVYPLFYCETVTSSNPDDKILDTRCLIVLKDNEHETYYSFRTNKDNPNTILDTEYLDVHDISDSLNNSEFNALVYRLRKNTVLHEELNFNKVNNHVKNTDITTSIGLTGIYDHNIIKGIKISGESIKTEDNTPIKNKTFHLYYHDGADWKFINSINTNSKGEYTYIDYSITDFIDNSPIGTQDELQNLIDTAIENNQSEIVLNKQYKFTSRNPIVVDSSIRINGNGHIIDGDNRSRLFDITGDNVILNNLILLNGNSGSDDGNGGAVQWTGANGELSNTVIAHSIANTKGGGVYWTGATGKIRNIRFIHNATNGDGGALYVNSYKFQAIGVISSSNYANGDGGCTYASGDYSYFENWIIHKDTTNGGSRSTFNSNGNYVTINGFNVSQAYFGRNREDYSTRAVDGQIKYMLLPSTWTPENTDFSVFNSYDLIYHASTSSKGEDKGIISLESDYCEYKFYNADNRLSNNTGLIINDTLKNNPVTVKLHNPLFEYANYNLTCTVRSVTGANIFDDDNDDYIVEDSFDILLNENEEIPIDVSNYSNDSVLLFDVESSIDFNVPEIVYPETLMLSSDKSSVDINEPVILSCKYTDTKNNPVVNALIRFKDNNNLIGQSYTNNDGIASFTYTPTVGGEHSISAEHNELLSNIIIVNVVSFDGISLSSDMDILSSADDEYATLEAQLTDNGSPVAASGETVSFEVHKVSDDSLVESLTGTTNASGVATVSYYAKSAGDIYVKAICNNINSNNVNIEDCTQTFMQTYFNHNSGTVTQAFNVNLPDTWKIECEMLITQSTGNSCFMRIGESDNKALLIGKVGSGDDIFKVYARNGTDLISTGSSIPISNNWQSITMTFDGTVFDFNNDIQVTNFNNISLTELLSASSWKDYNNSGQLRNIKIKPL